MNKLTNDYRYRLKKAEQEIVALTANCNRMENQVARYKTEAEEGERVENELKSDKRKLQREVSETWIRVEC